MIGVQSEGGTGTGCVVGLLDKRSTFHSFGTRSIFYILNSVQDFENRFRIGLLIVVQRSIGSNLVVCDWTRSMG